MAQQFRMLLFSITVILVGLAGCSHPSKDNHKLDQKSATRQPHETYPVTLVSDEEEAQEATMPRKPLPAAEQPPRVVYPVTVEQAEIGLRERRIAAQSGLYDRSVANAPQAMAVDPGGSRPRARSSLAQLRAPHVMPLENRENYGRFTDNPLRLAEEHPVSTFSIDVDTGSYTNVRRMLMQGQFPPVDAVRAEEFINYFDYADLPASPQGNAPFTLTTELGPSPWNARTQLLRVGVRGIVPEESGPLQRNLVFLIDVSGSMQDQNKLPLLKSALKLLTRQLNKNDRISMVVYAGAAGAVLEPTSGADHGQIMNAIDRLSAGGSTNGGAGIALAYQMARQAYIEEGVNRVILATDGDFNVGTVSFEALKALVAAQRKSGVALTTLGFGSGNYNDHLMEQIADVGDGNYFYVDTLNEAQKVLVRDLASTVQIIASDVKIQVEFNPAMVAEYRLIGYENRELKREDFNNDKVDAGEIGAGHRVTALYEITLHGSGGERIDPLRYSVSERAQRASSSEIAFVRLRYKRTQRAASELVELPVHTTDLVGDLAATSTSFRFAAAVSAFAQELRGSHYLEEWTYAQTAILAAAAKGEDPFGYRAEFIQLVQLADVLNGPARSPEDLEISRY